MTKMIKAKAIDTVAVGDIFCWSWGYDQTNIDYFLVTRKTKAMVEVVEIGSTVVEATGPMSAMVKPDPDSKIGDPQMKKPQLTQGGAVYLSMPFGWCAKAAPGEVAYSSWYA